MLKIAVVGGGASGLMSAILLAEKGCHVTLFEANSRVGKKIAASGNGHCNISNEHISIDNYAGLERLFAQFCLDNFSFKNLQSTFKRFGMLFDVKEDGKAYPFSHDSKSVVEILLMSAANNGVKILYDQKISSIEKNETFTLQSEANSFDAFDKVIIATGSIAAQQLGGNDSGYVIAESFGHSLVPAYPSLVQLELTGELHSKMSGVKKYSEVTLVIDKLIEDKIAGDVLFTSYGISGLAILDLSQKASLALAMGSRVDLIVNLLPKFDRQKLDSQILALCKQLPQASLHTLLSGIIHNKIVTTVLSSLAISSTTVAHETDSKMIKKIVNQLINWKFSVEQTHGFKYAEVSGGGVLTSEVNPKTMQSLKEKDLYIVGEVLDIVGDRGGYNFHFAWATAFCAAQAILA